MQDENPMAFPKAVDRTRIDSYKHFDQIYIGNHYGAFQIKADKEVRERYARLRYIVGNFGGLMSRVLADMLFGETPTISVDNKTNQEFVDALFEENQLLSQLYESELANSRRGDACFKLRIGPRNPAIPESTGVIIEEFPASNYFPVLAQDMPRNTPSQDVIAVVFKRADKTYLHKEIHTPGLIQNEVWRYSEDEKKLISRENPEEFGFKESEKTGVSRSLVFHIPNVRDGSSYFGTSDYVDLGPLMFALNNRLTSVDNILDKHSDPILAVPPGVLDEDGKVKKEALGMFEVDNETPGFNKPEYIVWNANLESAFSQIDKLIEMLFLFSEVSPSSAAMDTKSGGMAESGRALKFKLLATIRKKNRKQRYYDQFLKDLVETAMELSIFHKVKAGDVLPKNAERPKVKWPDGVLNDEIEQTELAGQRIDQGTLSRADAIARLDSVTPNEAQKKVKEIDEEAGPKLEVPANNISGGDNQPNDDQPPANNGG